MPKKSISHFPVFAHKQKSQNEKKAKATIFSLHKHKNNKKKNNKQNNFGSISSK